MYVVYGENNTPKPLNSQEDLLKTSENLNETPPKPTHLSPLEQANAKIFLKNNALQPHSKSLALITPSLP